MSEPTAQLWRAAALTNVLAALFALGILAVEIHRGESAILPGGTAVAGIVFALVGFYRADRIDRSAS